MQATVTCRFALTLFDDKYTPINYVHDTETSVNSGKIFPWHSLALLTMGGGDGGHDDDDGALELNTLSSPRVTSVRGEDPSSTGWWRTQGTRQTQAHCGQWSPQWLSLERQTAPGASH